MAFYSVSLEANSDFSSATLEANNTVIISSEEKKNKKILRERLIIIGTIRIEGPQLVFGEGPMQTENRSIEISLGVENIET